LPDRTSNIKEALKLSGGKINRWVLRLGKEKGEFEPWHEVGHEEDFDAFICCLDLKRIHEKIETRMKETKKLNKFKEKVGV
jgi:hypothetical protein